MQDLSINHHKNFSLHLLKAGYLLFWACWFSFAFITNFFDLLPSSTLTDAWRFRSGNYALLESVVSIYHLSSPYILFLFIADISIQFIAAILFFCAFIAWLRRKFAWQLINSAFALSIALWALFIIMEEFFIAYQYEKTHITLFLFELITLLSMHLLPD